MKVWVALLIFAGVFVVVGLAVFALYIITEIMSGVRLVESLSFKTVTTELRNDEGTVLWNSTGTIIPTFETVIGKHSGILIGAEWPGSKATGNKTLPYYFVLPRPAVSAKINVIKAENFYNNDPDTQFDAVLLTPVHVAMRSQKTGKLFTGDDVDNQVLGLIIVFTAA